MFSYRISKYCNKAYSFRLMSDSFKTNNNNNKKASLVSRSIAFIGRNRQQLINIFAVYLVLSFGIHNYQVKQAWDKLSSEAIACQQETVALKEALQDKDWITKVQTKVKQSKNENILFEEINHRITSLSLKENNNQNNTTSSSSKEIVDNSNNNINSNNNDNNTIVKGTEAVGISIAGNSSGRMI